MSKTKNTAQRGSDNCDNCDKMSKTKNTAQNAEQGNKKIEWRRIFKSSPKRQKNTAQLPWDFSVRDIWSLVATLRHLEDSEKTRKKEKKKIYSYIIIKNLFKTNV
jgi:hypothetical protein